MTKSGAANRSQASLVTHTNLVLTFFGKAWMISAILSVAGDGP
jgi:hypothetical protein